MQCCPLFVPFSRSPVYDTSIGGHRYGLLARGTAETTSPGSNVTLRNDRLAAGHALAAFTSIKNTVLFIVLASTPRGKGGLMTVLRNIARSISYSCQSFVIGLIVGAIFGDFWVKVTYGVLIGIGFGIFSVILGWIGDGMGRRRR